MAISTKLFNDQAINQLSRLTGDIQNIQQRIASGKNILRASDDPVAAVNISYARDRLTMMERYRENVERAQSRLSHSEVVVSDITNILMRAQELAIQGQNDTLSGSDRKAIGMEIAQLKEAMRDMANSRDANGDYLFSGYRLNTKPFQTTSSGGVAYAGDRGIHSLQISDSMKVNAGVDAEELFLRVQTEDGPTSLFSIMEQLEIGLFSNDVPENSVPDLVKAVEHLGVGLTSIGAHMNKADTQANSIDRRIMLMEEDMSNLEDADLSRLVTDLQTQIVSRDAAQQAFVRIGQQSLFDLIR